MQPHDDLEKNLEQTVEKYRKKKASNTSKSKAKADHKHKYKDCLFVIDSKPYLGSYCTICGKIHDWTVPTYRVRTSCGLCYRMMTTDAIFEKYKDLEKIAVTNLWAKYIPLYDENK